MCLYPSLFHNKNVKFSIVPAISTCAYMRGNRVDGWLQNPHHKLSCIWRHRPFWSVGYRLAKFKILKQVAFQISTTRHGHFTTLCKIANNDIWKTSWKFQIYLIVNQGYIFWCAQELSKGGHIPSVTTFWFCASALYKRREYFLK